MTREPNYIPKSVKASDLKITLSKRALEDGERVSFLEQQIQQAKDTYESSLENAIEECITLETTALQSEEKTLSILYCPQLQKPSTPWEESQATSTRRLLHSSTLITVSLPTQVPSPEIHLSPVTVLSIIWIQYLHPRSTHSPIPIHQQLNEMRNYYYIPSPCNQIKTKDFRKAIESIT